MVNVEQQELMEAIKSLQAKEPLFGVKKIAATLQAAHPEWNLTDKKVQKVMKRHSLTRPNLSKRSSNNQEEHVVPESPLKKDLKDHTPEPEAHNDFLEEDNQFESKSKEAGCHADLMSQSISSSANTAHKVVPVIQEVTNDLSNNSVLKTGLSPRNDIDSHAKSGLEVAADNFANMGFQDEKNNSFIETSKVQVVQANEVKAVLNNEAGIENVVVDTVKVGGKEHLDVTSNEVHNTFVSDLLKSKPSTNASPTAHYNEVKDVIATKDSKKVEQKVSELKELTSEVGAEVNLQSRDVTGEATAHSTPHMDRTSENSSQCGCVIL